MAQSDSQPQQPTGKAVRDAKGAATEKVSAPKDNRVQVHPGNVPVVTVQLLSDMNVKMGIIAGALLQMVKIMEGKENGGPE